MKKAKVKCPLAFALDEVGDRWTFLILRNAFFGERHFNGFVSSLGIARNILSNRLTKMVENELFFIQESEDKREIEYRLTPKAKELAGPLFSLRLWAEKWNPEMNFTGTAVDKDSAKPVDSILFKTKAGKLVKPEAVRIVTDQ